MKTIYKVNLYENKVEEISLFNSALTRKLDEMGIDAKDALIKICAETPKNEESEAIIKASLSHYAVSGYVLNGITYRPFMAGASDARKATATWVNEDIIPELGKWAMCGLQTKNMKLAINKYMAYIGLLSSASKPFEEVYGKKIDIDRVAVIKDCFVEVEDVVDFQTMTETNRNVNRKISINAFDGMALIDQKITGGEAGTGRGPWWKFLGVPTDFEQLKLWGTSFIDFWGNKINIDDVDLILTESCFKTVGLYESFEQYKNAFKELGHEVCVCVREHKPRLKGLPYQQSQTLLGTDDDALSFAGYAKSTVYKYHDVVGAPKLLRGAHRIAAGLYPALLTEGYTQRAMQEMYTTKRNDMLGGRIPELGYNAFLAPDVVAFVQHLFGVEVTGYLKAGECYCSNCKKGAVDVTRNPHLDNAHVILNNIGSMPLAKGPTMYINIFDMTTIRLRADYDGDHVWYSQNEHLLDLVNRTFEKLNNLPVDWEVGKAEKVNITKSAICSFITNLIHGSEIGLYADALTKMWNNGYDRDVCDWLTFAANVLIDAAKHASVKIKKPEAVTALNNVSLPLFAMYAKADAERPAGSDYWLAERVTKSGMVLPPRCKYSDSFLDKYSMYISKEIDETLTVEGLEDEIFDVTNMMFDRHRKIGKLSGLSKRGIFNPELNKMIECGVFQEIAFRHSTEWNKLIGDNSFFKNRREWEEETAKAARKEIIDWARAQYDGAEGVSDERIEDACYDIIVRNIFNTKMSEGMDTVVKQAFWRIYGDKAVKAIKQNLCTDVDFDSDEFAELFDTDDDDEE